VTGPYIQPKSMRAKLCAHISTCKWQKTVSEIRYQMSVFTCWKYFKFWKESCRLFLCSRSVYRVWVSGSFHSR